MICLMAYLKKKPEELQIGYNTAYYCLVKAESGSNCFKCKPDIGYSNRTEVKKASERLIMQTLIMIQ